MNLLGGIHTVVGENNFSLHKNTQNEHNQVSTKASVFLTYSAE
jgi:hypothetical protein